MNVVVKKTTNGQFRFNLVVSDGRVVAPPAGSCTRRREPAESIMALVLDLLESGRTALELARDLQINDQTIRKGAGPDRPGLSGRVGHL